jgi:hypothetical protein
MNKARSISQHSINLHASGEQEAGSWQVMALTTAAPWMLSVSSASSTANVRVSPFPPLYSTSMLIVLGGFFVVAGVDLVLAAVGNTTVECVDLYSWVCPRLSYCFIISSYIQGRELEGSEPVRRHCRAHRILHMLCSSLHTHSDRQLVIRALRKRRQPTSVHVQ